MAEDKRKEISIAMQMCNNEKLETIHWINSLVIIKSFRQCGKMVMLALKFFKKKKS